MVQTHGVIGNTTVFGTVVQGSSPCGSTLPPRYVFHKVSLVVTWFYTERPVLVAFSLKAPPSLPNEVVKLD